MSPSVLQLITFIIIALVVIILLFVFINRSKVKKYKRNVDYIEKEKNSIESAPILSELSKVESIVKNEKLEEKYMEWIDTFEKVKSEDISRLNDDIIKLDLILEKKDYKSFSNEYAEAELYLYKIKNKVGILLEEIEDLNGSEEKYRDLITRLKAKYRELNSNFELHKDSYKGLEDIIELQFENIEKRFQDFEDLMENNDYSEVMHIVKAIDTMIDHTAVVIDETPDLLLLCTKVIPKKIDQIRETYEIMEKEEFPLDYLNVTYNLDESLKKVNDIYDRIKVLSLSDCMFELKTINEYLDSIFNDFEKERNARHEYEDEVGSFNTKLNKTAGVVRDIYKQIDDIKNMYDLTENDIHIIDEVNLKLTALKKEYKKSIKKLSNSKTPYSKISQDLSIYTDELKAIEDDLDIALKSLGNMYNDEVRAREQLDEIQDLLNKSKIHIREYKLPFISENYFVQLNEANESIYEIIKELENKPIAIKTLNTRVDTARDLVLKVYKATNEMIQDASLFERLVIFGNKYRMNNPKINKEFENAEKQFNKGYYSKALTMILDSLEGVGINIRKGTENNEN